MWLRKAGVTRVDNGSVRANWNRPRGELSANVNSCDMPSVP